MSNGSGVAALYRRVAELAEDPPGGTPEGWRFRELYIYGEFDPEHGEWWNAAAEYVRTDQLTGTRRLIGGGPSVQAALRALRGRLEEPLAQRRHHTKGGWDTNWQPGRVEDGP